MRITFDPAKRGRSTMVTPSPPEPQPDSVCFTVDVEWACPAVVDDLRRLFDDHGIRATFFVTHAGVEVPGHERGLHPNFRRNGDSWRALAAAHPDGTDRLTEAEIYRHIVDTTLAFAPEAKGVRAHCLHYDSALMPVYRAAGLDYECSTLIPLTGRLRPFWKEHGLIGLPTYWSDHFDLMTGASGLASAGLHLDRPGLKVIDLHPNIVFLNAADEGDYQATKDFYHDPARLLAARGRRRGIRTLLLELLEDVARHGRPVSTVGAVAAAHRRNCPPWS